MTVRTTRTTISVSQPFELRDLDDIQPAGDHLLDTDEGLIEGLSRLYRSTPPDLPSRRVYQHRRYEDGSNEAHQAPVVNVAAIRLVVDGIMKVLRSLWRAGTLRDVRPTGTRCGYKVDRCRPQNQ
jgi:hypothetical protein